MVLLSGVITDPPKAIVVPLIVIPEFVSALLGIFVRVFNDPEIEHVSKVLFVTV